MSKTFDPSSCRIIEEVCGTLEKLHVETEAERQKIINCLSQAIHLASTDGKRQSSSAKCVARLDEHKKSHSDYHDMSNDIEVHDEVPTEHPNRSALADVADRSSEMFCTKGVSLALDKLINSTGELELTKQGLFLISEVSEFQKRNSLKFFQKLQEERESVLLKEMKLENEISRLNREITIMQTEFKLVEKTRVKALQTQLQALTKERDELRQKNEKLEDTLDTLKLMHSLQRSLSKEDDLKTKYERDLQSCKSEIAKLKDHLEQVVAERNGVVEERNRIIQERNELTVQYQEEYERAERLQRLVVALRQRARGIS